MPPTSRMSRFVSSGLSDGRIYCMRDPVLFRSVTGLLGVKKSSKIAVIMRVSPWLWCAPLAFSACSYGEKLSRLARKHFYGKPFWTKGYRVSAKVSSGKNGISSTLPRNARGVIGCYTCKKPHRASVNYHNEMFPQKILLRFFKKTYRDLSRISAKNPIENWQKPLSRISAKNLSETNLSRIMTKK